MNDDRRCRVVEPDPFEVRRRALQRHALAVEVPVRNSVTTGERKLSPSARHRGSQENTQ
jgi:hypothetical protein